MEDDSVLVFAEEFLAFGDAGDMWGAHGTEPVGGASIHAFHADPLGDDDLVGGDPSKIVKPMLCYYVFDFASCGCLFTQNKYRLGYCLVMNISSTVFVFPLN